MSELKHRRRWHALLALSIASGATALAYQVLWTRLFAHSFGVSWHAMSAVLAAFLGGLSLGAAWLGPVADRCRQPLRWYAQLELAVALATLLGLGLTHFVEPWHLALARRWEPASLGLMLGRCLLASIVILPPTILMGGTLSALVTAARSTGVPYARRSTLLYTANTLGGVLGALAIPFLGLPTWGVSVSWAATLLVNLLVVGLAAKMSLLREPGELSGVDPGQLKPVSTTPLAAHTSQWLGLVAIAISGFAALALEILWMRLAVLKIGSSSYAYSLVVATFLTGLVVGGWLLSGWDALWQRVLRRRELTSSTARVAYGYVQVLQAAAISLTLPGLGAGWPGSVSGGATAAGWELSAAAGHAEMQVGRWLWETMLAVVVIGLPTACMGAALPLAMRWYRESHRDDLPGEGRGVGIVLSAASLGNILGSLCAGFVLIPWLGLRPSILACAALSLVSGGWGLLAPLRRTRPVPTDRSARSANSADSADSANSANSARSADSADSADSAAAGGPSSSTSSATWLAWAGRGLAWCAVGTWVAFSWRGYDRTPLAQAVGTAGHVVDSAGNVGGTAGLATPGQAGGPAPSAVGSRIVFYEEGPVDTVAVIQNPSEPDQRSMAIDGVIIGQTDIDLDEKQQMLAHLPILVAGRHAPRRALTIGLGSGIVAGELARDEHITEVVAVEISPSVIRAAAEFARWNNDVLQHPKVRIVQDDGVFYLKRQTTAVDLIVADGKSVHTHGGNGVFFSAEFYRLCRDRLSDHGVFAQWLPMSTPPEHLAIIQATMHAEFEHTYLLAEPPFSLYWLATRRPLTWDDSQVVDLLGQEARAGLRRHGWTDPYQLLALFVADDPILQGSLPTATVNSLDRPRLELFQFRDFRQGAPERLRQNLQWLEELTPQQPRDWTLSGVDSELLAAHRKLIVPLLRFSREVVVKPGATETDAAETDVAETDVAETDVVGAELSRGATEDDWVPSLERLMSEVGDGPSHPLLGRVAGPLALELGLRYHRAGDLATAIQWYSDGLVLQPEDPGLLLNLTIACAQASQFPAVVKYGRRAVELNPGNWQLQLEYGVALLATGDAAAAAEVLARVVQAQPDNQDAQQALKLARRRR